MTRASTNQVRPWYRLHKSTWMGGMMVLMCLVLLIAPGYWDGSGRNDFGSSGQFEHGWPWMYLKRWTPEHLAPSGAQASRALWLHRPAWDWRTKVPESVTTFNAINLAGDLGIAIAILIAAAAAFEFWRRRRHRAWQIHLCDIALLVLVVAVALVWWRGHQSRWTREQQALQQLAEIDPSARNHSLTATNYSFPMDYNGPDWLRKLAGLAALPRTLESVDSGYFFHISPDRDFHRIVDCLSAMPNLRSLVVYQATDSDVEALRPLQQVEELTLASHPFGAAITDAAVPALGGMTHLRSLSLCGTQISDSGLAQLPSSSRLTSLFLSESPVTAAGVQRLRERLPNCSVSGTW